MARTTKKTALIANMTEALARPSVEEMSEAEFAAIMDSLEVTTEPAIEILADAELEQALNEGFEPVVEPTTAPADMAQALAEAHGASQTVEILDPTATYADQAANQAADPAQAQIDPALPFTTALDAVTEIQVNKMTTDLLAAFADRAKYEREANPNNDNIQKTISKCIKGITPGIVKALVVNGTIADYINESEVTGKRRNVYALEKLRDILYGAVTGYPQNAINQAILVSMVKLDDLKLPFTGAVAKACASDKVAVDPTYKPHLRRHTVAEGTASTQMSSTMTALEVLGVVKNTGTRQHPIFELTATPLAQRLVEVVRTKMQPVAA